ncbi:MAG: hypothetical protein K0R02_217 [Rickettsiaceae bacterium]|jgi:hypothetical protein|nr:hypothetical protein [Rickettsiaceae bacterium]
MIILLQLFLSIFDFRLSVTNSSVKILPSFTISTISYSLKSITKQIWHKFAIFFVRGKILENLLLQHKTNFYSIKNSRFIFFFAHLCHKISAPP